jgi:hypothetical protein
LRSSQALEHLPAPALLVVAQDDGELDRRMHVGPSGVGHARTVGTATSGAIGRPCRSALRGPLDARLARSVEAEREDLHTWGRTRDPGADGLGHLIGRATRELDEAAEGVREAHLLGRARPDAEQVG